MKDRDVLFHQKWLGLAQPMEGLVFSVPALADAQIAPEERPELSAAFVSTLDGEGLRIRDLASFFRGFLGYSQPGMLVPREALSPALSFYAAEGGQEIRPSYALGRGPFADEEEPASASMDASSPASAQFFALVWDLTEAGVDIDLDASEALTGPWRYPPTAKLERLLRHVGVPIGLLFNGKHLRLVYAPAGESTGHLTFRVEHLKGPEGRPLLAALHLLLHARRAYTASAEHTLAGLLAESRRRQADVTEELARQVFEAVEILLAGFEAAASRDCVGARLDWLRPAVEAEGDHFYQGVLAVVLRLVFLLYAEDQALLPVEHPVYAEHLGLTGLYARLSQDAGAHPESMHHRFGAYGQLLSLFRAVFLGVRFRDLDLPPRRGKLFDPNTYPFLEGGLPGWTAAVVDPQARAETVPPSLDDGTVYRVLHCLMVLGGQRLSYRTLDVVQIGSVYESLMGYHVERLESAAVRLGKLGVWVETRALRGMGATDRARFLKETCGLNPGPIVSIEKALKEAGSDEQALVEALSAHATGRRGDMLRHRASMGRLVLQPGEERRRTGTHYTPPALTEKVVRRTLEPLLACLGAERTPEQILQLKVCDPAMGSGAFLVAACRALAEELVSAWTRRGELAGVLEAYGDAHLHARRLVAQRCLYGVDKNAAAVELAKLSLWLVTLSRTLPFTFVDHALRHGDSLVGLDFKQIESFHWSPPGQVELVRVLLKDALDQAVELRQDLLGLADHEDPASQAEKRRLFDFSQQAIERVRKVADVCVGAFFAEGKEAGREKERRRRLGLVERWIAEEDAEAEREIEVLAAEVREKIAPFHWWIEFPEVFFEARPDPLDGGKITGAALMEGVVGNPPFLGGKRISTEYGDNYLAWLGMLYPGSMNADFSAYFVRRAGMLLGQHGTFGLIATNTIAQGDTRTTGLAAMVQKGWMLYDATNSMPWPGAAAVTVSLVHGAHGNAKAHVRPVLDGRDVQAINSLLRPSPERADPQALMANAGAAYVGTYVLGTGFTLTLEERDALLAKDQRNADRIFPYLGGEEVNSSPVQGFERFVINFGRMDLAIAQQWPDLIMIVEKRVRPERATNKRERYREIWWQFAEPQTALQAAIAPLERCLVTARVTKHLCFSFQPTNRIFNEKLYVFPLDHYTAFAVLQSRLHSAWTWLLSSTMKTDLNYSATDCFENFPFPDPNPRTKIPSLEAIGERLYAARAAFMVERNVGLTKTYNALKDPENAEAAILALRALHEQMDRAVLDAYGWNDIAVPPYCPSNDEERKLLATFEDEIIDKLYVLNAERAREEARAGLGKAAKKAPKAAAEEASAEKKEPAKSTRKKKAPKPEKGSAGEGQGSLF